MKQTKTPHAPGRKEQRTPPRNADPYRDSRKAQAPGSCPRCGATYQEGHWSWLPAPASAERRTCPACLRIEQRQPAGFVSLGGPFFTAHREEVMRLVRAHELRERTAHPLQRLIGVEDDAQGVLVTTTDAHLARGLAVALHDAFHGDLDLDFAPGENQVRARWYR